MARTRKICVVTGSRADYGLLQWLMRAIADDAELTLQLVVTGAHLSTRFGATVQEIERDGFAIDARVPILDDDDSRVATAIAMSRALQGIALELARLRPDFVVVLGDRYEILAAAEAAVVLGVPLAHIHGGELTEGALDDSFRHAITKFATVHFVAAEAYRTRVIQMGEDPARVHVVGALGVEGARRIAPLGADELDRLVRVPLSGPTFLVTYHPVTVGAAEPQAAVGVLIEALMAHPEARIVVTGVNADHGNRGIRAAFESFAAAHPDRVTLHDSLGARAYLSLMRKVQVVIGNSSSAVIEAPALGVPAVDIGTRQAGRIKPASVLTCGETTAEILKAIATAMSPEFRRQAGDDRERFGDGHVSERIVAILKSLDAVPSSKRFHDLVAA